VAAAVREATAGRGADAVLPFDALPEALRLVAERRVIGRVALRSGPARPA
jgi:hypothetical protein